VLLGLVALVVLASATALVVLSVLVLYCGSLLNTRSPLALLRYSTLAGPLVYGEVTAFMCWLAS